MRKWIVRLAILAVLIVVGVALRRTVFAPKPVPVRTVTIGTGAVEATVTNSKAGTVEARRRAGLSTGTAGIVAALEVERGDRVSAGQVLLRLDDASQRSELARTQRQLALAQAKNGRACLAAERSKRELDRNRKLAEKDGIVSIDRLDALQSSFDLATADCQVAAADVELALAAVQVAQTELDKTVLVAPFDAIVADVSVELGEWVTPSVPLMAAPDLIDAIDPSSLYVSAPMDEVDARLLSLGQKVRVTIDPYPDQEFWGRVSRIAPYVLDVEQQNRTLEIEVVLDDAEFSSTLLPGTSADVEVLLEVKEDVLRIPTFASMEGSRVLVLEDDRLEERHYRAGIKNWNWTEVLDGLVAGNEVVTSLDRSGVEDGAEAVNEATGAAP